MGTGLHIIIPLSKSYSWESAASYIADTYCPIFGKPGKAPQAKPSMLRAQNESHASDESYSFDASSPKGVDHRALSRFRQWYFEEVEIYADLQELCQPEPEQLQKPPAKEPDKKRPVEIQEPEIKEPVIEEGPELVPLKPEQLPPIEPLLIPIPQRLEPLPPIKKPEEKPAEPKTDKPKVRKPKAPNPGKEPDKLPKVPINGEIPL